MIPVGVVAGLGVYGVVVAVLTATEGVLPVAAHGAVDALQDGLALVVGQALQVKWNWYFIAAGCF